MVIIINKPSDKGKKDFQVKFIKESYRIRGSLARIHRKVKERSIVIEASIKSVNIEFDIGRVKKNTVDNNLIIIIFVYSAIKINAKAPLLNSVLNPETSSDSPSAKSNGVRFVSAKVVVNHTKNKGRHIRINIILWSDIMECRFRDENAINTDIKISAILTSYEIVCAILRRAPKSEYLEFDAHPAPSVVYTLILEIHRNNRTPYFKK